MSLRDYGLNEKVAQRLSSAVESGHIMHACIFEGDLMSPKEKLAFDFFKAIACSEDRGFGCDICAECRKIEGGSYEDLYIVSSQSKDSSSKTSIKVSDILEMQKFLMKKPVGSARRHFVIIKDADRMTIEAQDKLLKTLEEPPEGAVIVLLCENSESLLITVRSRCVKFYLAGERDLGSGGFYDVAQEVVRMAIEDELFEKQKKFLLGNVKDKNESLMFFDAMEMLMSDFIRENTSKLMDRRQAIKAIEYIEESRRSLAYNCNYKYVLCSLILKIGG